VFGDILFEMPVESTDDLAEWLCVAFMRLVDEEGLLIGGRIDPAHAYQIAKLLVSSGLVTLDPEAPEDAD
jgi:hypothetical protein